MQPSRLLPMRRQDHTSPYAARAGELTKQLEDKLGVRGDDFETKLKRAGRRLPRPLRKDGQQIAHDLRAQSHPKLGRMIDANAFQARSRALESWLSLQDPKARRRERFWNIAASIAFNLVIAIGGAIVFARYQGLI